MKKLIENSDFEIFSNYIYNDEILEKINVYFEKMKIEILDFFNLNEFRKVKIYLFESKDEYCNFMIKNGIHVFSYSKGRCLNGDIYYTFNKDNLDDRKKVGYNIASIVHEFVHLVYYEKINKKSVPLIEEGLAIYLSGQKSLLEKNEEYEKWLKKNIISKELPKYECLCMHGDKYGEFVDSENLKYNGYDISYSFVKYVNENLSEDIIGKVLIKQNTEEIKKYYTKFKNWIKSIR